MMNFHTLLDKNYFQGAGEIAYWVRFLLCKHGDLSSDLYHACMCGMAWLFNSYNPSAGWGIEKWGRGISRACWIKV